MLISSYLFGLALNARLNVRDANPILYATPVAPASIY